MPNTSPPTFDRPTVVRLWFERQGLADLRGSVKATKRALTRHLERTGALQLDTITVLDRAHYLTLWSRFGVYDRKRLDRWIYRDRIAYEYWGHEASILPISHLPLGVRRMRRFPPESWRNSSWWPRYATSTASRRRVLRRLRAEGPLESSDFESRPDEFGGKAPPGGSIPLPKEDKRSLQLLWHSGKIAIHERRHFRRIYDLAERIYPEVQAASNTDLQNSWLRIGLAGNGIASEKHLVNYWTGPKLKAPERKRVIARHLQQGSIVEVQVEGMADRFYALPEHLEGLDKLPAPRGTNLICPFDSLLWQRQRAEDLLDFHYRIEIYVPEKKREFGYYVLSILHDGALVGRLDPKLHRDRAELEIRSIHLEPGFRRDAHFDAGFAEALRSLGEFVAAEQVTLPKGWRRLL